MISLKPGVKLTGLAPQIVLALLIVHEIYRAASIPCVVTSANDSQHGENSLHSRDGLCRAVDVRTKTWLLDKQQLRIDVKAALGDDFDVVLEHLGEDNEHLHVEYDPK